VFDQTGLFSFQPYFYADQFDGPHNDDEFIHIQNGNPFSLFLTDGGQAFLTLPDQDFASGTWSLNRTASPVPIPATLPLMGLGLAMLAFARRKAA
jgi:hypothetical protein